MESESIIRQRAQKIELVPIEKLIPNPDNRNTHPEDQILDLMELIKYQGFREPLTVSNQTGYIVGGEGRLIAAKRLNMTHLPVIFQDFDSPEQEYAHGIALNALARRAFLDLGRINIDLPNLGPDFEVRMLGIKDFVIEPAEKFDPNKEWTGMPEFDQVDKTSYQKIVVHFFDQTGVEKFSKLIGQPITRSTRFVWYPEIVIERYADKRYGSET